MVRWKHWEHLIMIRLEWPWWRLYSNVHIALPLPLFLDWFFFCYFFLGTLRPISLGGRKWVAIGVILEVFSCPRGFFLAVFCFEQELEPRNASNPSACLGGIPRACCGHRKQIKGARITLWLRAEPPAQAQVHTSAAYRDSLCCGGTSRLLQHHGTSDPLTLTIVEELPFFVQCLW